jgi:hypothetical protein
MRRICTLLLCALSFTASAAELTPPTHGPAAYPLSAPVIASNGQTFLTLWTMTVGQLPNVYGSLADASGNVVTPASFLVAPDAAIEQVFPYNGAYVAVVTRENRSQIAFLGPDGRLIRYGATLPELIRSSSSTIDPPRVSSRAFNGGVFFTVYETGMIFPPSKTLAQVARIDGTLVRDAIPITALYRAKVTVSQTGFTVVARTDNGDGLFLQRFTSDGVPAGPRVTLATFTTMSLYDLTVASSGSDTAVAWTDRSPQAQAFDAHVRIISSSGEVIGGPDFPTDVPWGIRIFWLGTNYLATFGGHFAAIDQTGGVVHHVTTASAVDDVAVAGSVIRAVALRVSTIVGYTIEADTLTAADTAPLSITLRRQVFPEVAASSAGLLAVWSDQRADGTSVGAMPLTNSGVPLRSEQVDVGTSYAGSDLAPPRFAVASGTNIYLVVYRQPNGDVVARRLDRSGNLLDSEPLLLQKNAYISDQAVAWTGTAFFVITSTSASLVTESGDVKALGNVSSSYSHPAVVASNASQTLVASPVYAPCGPIPECWVPVVGLSLVRFQPDGTRSDAQPTTIPASGGYHLATSGHEFALVTTEGGAKIRTIHTEGPQITVSDPAPLLATPATGATGAVATNVIWDGMNYVVSWRSGIGDQQSIGVARFDRVLHRVETLYADVRRVDFADTPAIAPAAPGDALLLFSRVTTAAGVARLWSMREHDMQPLIPSARNRAVRH